MHVNPFDLELLQRRRSVANKHSGSDMILYWVCPLREVLGVMIKSYSQHVYLVKAPMRPPACYACQRPFPKSSRAYSKSIHKSSTTTNAFFYCAFFKDAAFLAAARSLLRLEASGPASVSHSKSHQTKLLE